VQQRYRGFGAPSLPAHPEEFTLVRPTTREIIALTRKNTPAEMDLATSYAGRPIHLTGSTNINANSSASINNQALHSPVAGHIMLQKFKFGALINWPSRMQNGDYAAFSGGAVSVQVQLNDQPITKGFVPIWNFGRSINPINEQIPNAVTNSLSNVNIYDEFDFDLPKPMLYTPSDQLNVSFQHNGQQAITATVRFSAAGRVLPDSFRRPTSRHLPYVASYTTKTFSTALAAADFDMSTETDLYNATNEIIYLQRLSGRLNLSLTGSYSNTDGGSLANTGAGITGGQDDLSSDLLTLTVLSAHGDVWVPNGATFREVFSPVTRTWELDNQELLPGDYVIANFTKAAGAGGAAVYAQASVALVGVRELSV